MNLFQSDADYFNMFLCGLYAVGNSLELLITCRIGDFITQEVILKIVDSIKLRNILDACI